MNIELLCVGKIKERYLRDAIAEYAKRLSRYATVTIKEVRDEKTGESLTEKERMQITNEEGNRLLAKLPQGAYTIVLALDGQAFSSEEFSIFLNDRMVEGKSTLVFVIGGSLGLSEKIIQKADKIISFSKMTFPHQLMRVILLEQIYRGFKILRHEPYHK